MSDEFKKRIIAKIAARREEMHKHDPSGRQLTNNTHETGLHGEFAFGELTGILPDLKEKRNGDDGVDFIIPVFMKVDVKTRKERPGGLSETFLLVEEGKVTADIYVLAVLSKDESVCNCVGWMKKEQILTYPVGDLGTKVVNHQVPALDLHPMDSLVRRISRLPRPGEL